MKNKTIIYLILITLISCNNSKEEIFWVSGYKKKENNVSTLLVQKSDTLKNEKFVSLNKDIEGFNFEEGYLKKIKVKTQKNKYVLIKEIEKKVDYRKNIIGKWSLEIENDSILNLQKPILNINLNNMNFQGYGFCNNYRGNIENINFNSIKFGKTMSTKKHCALIEHEIQYLNQIKNINTYLIKGPYLIFYNDNGMKLMTFKKRLL